MKYLTAKFNYTKKYLYITLTYRPYKLNKKIKISIENIPPVTIQSMLEEWIDKFCLKNPEYLPKEILRAFARVDDLMKNLYKVKYKHGGFRNRSTKRERKNKTEQLGKRLTPEEKDCLLKCLEVYRKISSKEKILLLKYLERCYSKYTELPQKENIYIKENKILQELQNLDFS